MGDSHLTAEREVGRAVWIPHVSFRWREPVKLFCWHIGFPLLWVSAPVKTAVFLLISSVVSWYTLWVGNLFTVPVSRRSERRREGWVKGTPTERRMAASSLLSGVPRKGACPGMCTNAEERAPATGRGGPPRVIRLRESLGQKGSNCLSES